MFTNEDLDSAYSIFKQLQPKLAESMIFCKNSVQPNSKKSNRKIWIIKTNKYVIVKKGYVAIKGGKLVSVKKKIAIKK